MHDTRLDVATEADITLQRLFFALWPAPALQRQFARLPQDVLSPHARGRHSRTDTLHVTLAFLGPIRAATRDCLVRRADEIHVPVFDLAFDQLGCFRRHGLLWAGASRIPPPLLHVVDALRAAQLACGLAPEQRAFQAHITLVRHLRHCPPDAVIEPIVWTVREFVLVRSDLSADGARYDVLRTWTLA
jgi:2'-5' RNA ligase